MPENTILTTQLGLLATRIGNVCKAIEGKVDADVADLASYKTTAATSLSDAIAALKSEILGGASSAYDTLKELEDILKKGDDSFDAALKALMCVSYEHAQSLTEAQKTIARSNIGVASGADVTALDTRLTTAEGNISSQGTRLATAEGDIDAVEGRMGTAESAIDAAEGRLDTAESDIDALETLIGSTANMDFVSTFNTAYNPPASGD